MDDTISSLASVDSGLLGIRDELAQQNDETLNDAISQLEASGSPTTIMQQLAPHLFRPSTSTENGMLSSQEALSILSVLVARDSSRYIEPASVAVRKEALRLEAAVDEPMVVSPELLAVIIQQLCSGTTGVSNHADLTLVACSRKLGVERFGSAVLQSLVESWRGAWNGEGGNSNSADSSTVCVRCASCIASIAALGDDFMRAAVSTGAMTLILQLLGEEDDVLLAMSSLDILEKFATTKPMHHERAGWLYSEPVLLPLLEMAGGAEESVPDPVLGGPALRVLSQLCKVGHKDQSLFARVGQSLLKGFYQALHNFDVAGELDRLAKVDAISSFASASPDALQMVLDDASIRQDWLSLAVAQPKLKAAILYSIAMVLDPGLEVDMSGDTAIGTESETTVDENGCRRLYFTFGQVNGDEPSSLLLAIARSPLPELRIGAYAVLTGVAKLPTGPQILLGHAPFLEFLLSRPPHETTKEGREAKYDLVKTVYRSRVKGLLADNIVDRLKKYLEQGALFVEAATWELATED